MFMPYLVRPSGGMSPVPASLIVIVIIVVAGGLASVGYPLGAIASVLVAASFISVDLVGRLNAVLPHRA
ncbi:hypothetical protein [Streptodolium elevatio]|uniref:Uncharacterized protein n=1 Tax=Streptodolium elevatio TaxID=3157996 RepID=A0ABV3DNQ3_9ACTN